MNNLFLKKPETCPKCRSERIAYIVYGLPHFTKELYADIAEEKIVPGGCCVTENDPVWQCADCGTSFYRAELDIKNRSN